VNTPASTTQPAASGYTITPRQRYWMNSKPYQLLRFVILNLRILRAVDHSKRS